MVQIFTRTQNGKETSVARIHVPKRLRPLIGRNEFHKRLSDDQSAARLQGQVFAGRVAHLFQLVSERGAFMTREQIEQLIGDYVHASLDAVEHTVLNKDDITEFRRVEGENGEKIELEAHPGVTDGYEHVLSSKWEDLQFDLEANRFDAVVPDADALLTKHKLKVDKGSMDYKRLARELMKAKMYLLRLESDMLNGRDAYIPPAQRQQRPTILHQNQADPPTPASKPIGEVVEGYFNHYVGRSKRTVIARRRLVTLFVEGLPEKDKTPVQSVTKAHCIAFRDSYQKAIDATHTTMNQVLAAVHHLFTYALKHDLYVGNNPCAGIHYDQAKSESYDPFTDADLEKIFPRLIAERGGKYYARYYLTMVLAFSGLRREEACQLTLTDVRQVDGVWCFDLTGKHIRVKTTNSRRRVPLHQALLDDVKLLDYIERLKSKGETMLFPYHPKVQSKQATIGHVVSKWHSRHLLSRLAPLSSDRLNMHSYRHMIGHRLRVLETPEAVSLALLGHSGKGVGMKVYGHLDRLPLPMLKKYLDQIVLPSVKG